MPSFVGEYAWLIGGVVVTVELVLAIAAWRWYARRASATRRFVRFAAVLLILVTVVGGVFVGTFNLLVQAT